ncbi:MAG: tRNA uridine-5-carboxymethylaminomethyl(34) synthesis GTPase MnmE, partial [Planctomycetota bacterium]
AAGPGLRAVVRVSGPEAVAIAQAVFRSAGPGLAELGGFRAVAGRVVLAEHDIETPARAYRFVSPRSYTRQDLIELHIPGGAALAGALLDALIACGARLAEAGEFTARAFFSGRVDLSQAEAVADIISASDESHLRASLCTLGGELRKLCETLACEIAEALATVEASIDLAEERIELASPARLAGQLRDIAARLGRTARGATDMPETASLPSVAIAGEPNVGKSSLLNALAMTDRAITSALAGTTRDVLSATMTLPCGSAVNLLDVAGFTAPTDSLATMAHDAASQAVAQADMILFVAQAGRSKTRADDELLEKLRATNRSVPVVLLANKADLVEKKISQLQVDDETIYTSAVTGEGLDAVRQKLTKTLHLASARPGSAMGLHDRQRRAMQLAGEAAIAAAELLGGADEIADVAELVAVELREALGQLGTISGEIVTEDILGKIFARFCVGK